MITLNNLTEQSEYFLTAAQANIPITLGIIAVLWLFHFLNILLGYRLNHLGIYPRTLHGTLGVVFSPVLHGSFNHLFFNSIPLFVLINFVLLGGVQKFIGISVVILVVSGLLLWLFGRRAYHIGASSMVTGYWSYLLVNAYQHPSALSVILAIVCLYYFGGMLFSIFPTEETVSWEGHLFGFVAGLVAAYIFS